MDLHRGRRRRAGLGCLQLREALVIGDVRIFQCFPVNGWLIPMAQGWTFDLVAEPMRFHHGFWSVLMIWTGAPDAV